MYALNHSLVVLLLQHLLVGGEARNLWSSFLGEGNTATKHSHQPAAATQPDLCSSLLTNMEMVTKATPDTCTCQPLQDKVSGEYQVLFGLSFIVITVQWTGLRVVVVPSFTNLHPIHMQEC